MKFELLKIRSQYWVGTEKFILEILSLMLVVWLATHIQSGYGLTDGSNFHTHIVKNNGSLRKSQKELGKKKKNDTSTQGSISAS